VTEAELLATWTRGDLRELVERALANALTGTDYNWYLATRERGHAVETRSDRYVLYARSQPWAEGLLEHHWNKRSPWPEGQFFTIDLSLECGQLILTHSNDRRNTAHNLRNAVLYTATTVSLYTLASFVVYEHRRAWFEQYCGFSSLEGIVRWMIETCAPNQFSVT
jgi:hypothetical protein